MSDIIFEFEVMYNGKETTWEFDTAKQRDKFFETVVNRFSGKEYKNKNQALISPDIIQVSVSNVMTGSLENMADIIPHKWYDGEIIDELIDFVNAEYLRIKTSQ